MTGRLCGAPHHHYPETLCTEPAGHYRPDRDPHAGPLIVDGREHGGAAWDEPKERRMTGRHTVDSITSDALDALYDRIATLEHVAAGNKRHVQLIVPELERAEAALARVRALAERWRYTSDRKEGPLRELRQALGEQPTPAPAATEATDDACFGKPAGAICAHDVTTPGRPHHGELTMTEVLPASATVITRIRSMRKARGMSAQATADAITAHGFALKRGMLASQECGRIKTIPVDQVVAAAKAFGVSVSDLLEACSACQGAPPKGFTCNTCGTGTRED